MTPQTPTLTWDPAMTTLQSGSSVTLTCIYPVTASVNYYRFWKDGNFLSTSNTGTYVLNSVVTADSGTYTCNLVMVGDGGSGFSNQYILDVPGNKTDLRHVFSHHKKVYTPESWPYTFN